MPWRCVLGGCSNTTKDGLKLHLWLKEKKLAQSWTKFVQRTRVWKGPSQSSYLCSAHFDPSCYVMNEVALLCGYESLLKSDAFPAVLSKRPAVTLQMTSSPGYIGTSDTI
ncbi:UNVERIFIED_CONTAM: hypothetical protein FKN15_059247 [Acipenser sinensis]